MDKRGSSAGGAGAIAAVVIVTALVIAGITVAARDGAESSATTLEPLGSRPTTTSSTLVEAGAKSAPTPADVARSTPVIASTARDAAWAAMDVSWSLVWSAHDLVAWHLPPGLDRIIEAGEAPFGTATHLYGTVDDGRWWAVDILGERPCGHLRGEWFSCEPWSPDDPWWVPAFIREHRDDGGRRVVVYGMLPPGTGRIAVTFTDDSWGDVVYNERIWGVAIPEGADVRMVAFADDEDNGIMQLDRVPPDGWWMNEFE